MLLVQGKQTDHWNRIKNPETNPHKYESLINDRSSIEDHLENREIIQ